jgi:hypothetical protein
MTRKIRDGASVHMSTARCHCGRLVPVRLSKLGFCCLACANGKVSHHQDCDRRGVLWTG